MLIVQLSGVLLHTLRRKITTKKSNIQILEQKKSILHKKEPRKAPFFLFYSVCAPRIHARPLSASRRPARARP